MRILWLIMALAFHVSPAFARQNAAEVSDEQVLAVWDKLNEKDQREIGLWFEAEAQRLDTYQNGLINWIRGTVEHDPHDWPKAEPAPLYDAATHAPAQPIQRRFVKTDSSTAKKAREQFFAEVPKRQLDPAFVYDWARGTVVHVADRSDPARIVRNGLAGYPPGLDLAEALVTAALDDGSQRKILVAFGHAYADRSGDAIPGVTLYDAWASGSTLEMPDVECLGIVHDLSDDWKTWTAPVPGNQQEPLYDHIGEYFTDARRFRGLRTALARTWLTGNAVLRDNYGGTEDILHAIWESHSATPSSLLEELPAPKHWERWLERWANKVNNDPKEATKGRVRRRQLAGDAARVRRVLVGVMREYGALK